MERHAFRKVATVAVTLSVFVTVSLAGVSVASSAQVADTLGTSAKTNPTSTPNVPILQKYCIEWTVPDMHPAANEQRRLDEIKATQGVTIMATKIAREVCFNSEKERDEWVQTRNHQEYTKWLQQQPEYQEYLRSKQQSGMPESSVGPDSTAAAAVAYLYRDSGYGGGSSYPYSFAGGCSGGSGWAVPYVGDAWNDWASSSMVNSDSGCNTWGYYPDAYFGGTEYGCASPDGQNCWYVGDAINDRTSSFAIWGN